MQKKDKIPKELVLLINALEFVILENELDLKILTYNQMKTIFTYFWDY